MRNLFTLLLLSYTFSAMAQSSVGFWQPVDLGEVYLPAGAERLIEPHLYTAYTLDYEGIKQSLARAPREFTAAAGEKACIVDFPMEDGHFERFRIVEVQTMPDVLAAKFPEIRTYGGHSLDTPGKRIRITLSPDRGLEAFIRYPDKRAIFLEPLAAGQNRYYMAYDQKDLPSSRPEGKTFNLTKKAFGIEETDRAVLKEPSPEDRSDELNVKLKIYRFAAACQGEFSQLHGGTLISVMAKVVATTNALNEVYEADLNIRLVLIDQEDKIIFLDPETDPYTGLTVFDWMSQNPNAMGQALGGADKYDIGHVFARLSENPGGAIGVAGGLCCTQNKGRGCSAWRDLPFGADFFAIIGQEIGHQWAAGHTFSSCGDNQYDTESACEPGSGSTIMSYSGACNDNNVQNGLGDLYYHACSIKQIRRFVEQEEGATCGTEIELPNRKPVVNIPYPNNLFVPISTPFALRGNATDPDGDPLTYAWDEIDVGPIELPLGTAQGTSPLFRSFPGGASPTRYFPRMNSIITNTPVKTEILPDYTREMKFAFIARDNKPGGGGITMDTIELNATELAGPFRVLYPTSSITNWVEGSYEVVEWDVANTDKSPVNCKFVDIVMSKNNGFLFNDTLAKNIPNIGKGCVKVPAGITNSGRIMVRAADNVFFDISNASFKVIAPTAPDFSMCPQRFTYQACLPNKEFKIDISTASLLNFTTPLNFSVTGLPAGATATFSKNPVTPGEAVTLIVAFADNTPEAVYPLSISASGGATPKTHLVSVTTVNNYFSALALESPFNGKNGVESAPFLNWTAIGDANSYQLQMASSPSFEAGTILNELSGLTIDSVKTPSLLGDGQVVYWRVRPVNECGPGAWTEPFVFSTGKFSCAVLSAPDLPKTIPTGVGMIESKITIPAGGTVDEVIVKRIQGNHARFNDLEVRLISPSGTEVLLFNNKCGSIVVPNFDFGFKAGAPTNFQCPPSSSGAVYKPTGNLGAFSGQSSAGTWTLRVKDNVSGAGGAVNFFDLELCSKVALNPPLIVVNNKLALSSGTNAPITQDLLKATDANNTAAQLLFTVMTPPSKGILMNNGAQLLAGGTFTQADIDNGTLRYFDYGWNAGDDSFRFTVVDGEGGLDEGTFVVGATTGLFQPDAELTFDVAPNPARETLAVYFSRHIDADATIMLFDAAGRQIRTWNTARGTAWQKLDLGRQPQGIYFVQVRTENASGVKRIIIE